MARTGRPPKNPADIQAMGERIKQRMAELGISGKELAITLNTPHANISRYRNGQREPSGKQLVELAQALNTTAEYLITG